MRRDVLVNIPLAPFAHTQKRLAQKGEFPARGFLPHRRHIENIVPIAIGIVFTHNLQVHIETITPTPMWSMCLLCDGLTLHGHP
jgi:hypothetical protein